MGRRVKSLHHETQLFGDSTSEFNNMRVTDTIDSIQNEHTLQGTHAEFKRQIDLAEQIEAAFGGHVLGGKQIEVFSSNTVKPPHERTQLFGDDTYELHDKRNHLL